MKQEKLMTKKIRFKNLITKQENFPIRIWNVPGGHGLSITKYFEEVIDP